MPKINSTCLLLLVVCLPMAAMADVTTLTRARASGDVKVAPNGDIYISDFGNPGLGNGDSVVRILPDGSQSVFVDGQPRALAGNDFDSQGNLIQAAFGTNRIYRIDPAGNATILATLSGPVGIAVDEDDVIYSTQCNPNAISRVDPDGTVTQIASGGGLSCPNGMDIGHDGAFYVVNNRDGGMYRVGLNGSVDLFATIPGGGNGHVVFTNNHYYVAGRLAHRIYQVDSEGVVTAFAGTGVDGDLDGPNLEATISRPNGIGASPDGRFLYVTGSSNFTAPDLPIRQIDLPQGADFQINAGLSGAWFNPETAGQGMLFDVIPSSNMLFAAWFTYETDSAPSSAKIGSTSHRWFTAQGPYQDDTAELTITSTAGGVFDDPMSVINSSAGSAQLTFASCTEAIFDYQLDEEGLQGTIELIRLTPDELCTVVSQVRR